MHLVIVSLVASSRIIQSELLHCLQIEDAVAFSPFWVNEVAKILKNPPRNGSFIFTAATFCCMVYLHEPPCFPGTPSVTHYYGII